MEMDIFTGLMEEHLKDHGEMVNKMGLGNIWIAKEFSNMGNGKMAHEKDGSKILKKFKFLKKEDF